MSETLTELVAKITTDAAGLKSGLSDAEKQTEISSQKMQDSLKKVGTVMAASGATITAALGMMGKAAIDEEINMKRLATTINNSGTAYDSVKDSMEALIATTQRKTGIADNEQRDILNRLILTTGDYATSLKLLPTVLDLASAGEMDATTAATYLGKAHNELAAGAKEVSVRFGQASLKFKSMEDIQNRVAGAAENLANPLSILKASIGDVAEEIGMILLPVIKDTTSKIVDIAIKVQDWVKENPALAKTLVIVAAALGIVLTVVGGLILILPTLISGVAAFGVVFNVALGPIGLIALAIAGLIVGGILLWKNWDKIKIKAMEIWNDVKDFLVFTWRKITEVFKDNWEKILAIMFPPVGIPLLLKKQFDQTEIVTDSWVTQMTKIIKDGWEKWVLPFSAGFGMAAMLVRELGGWGLFWDSIKAKTVNIWDGIKEYFSDTWDTIVGFFRTSGDKISETWYNTWSRLGQFFVDIWTNLSTTTKKIWGNILSFIEGAVNGAITAINWLIEKFNSLSTWFNIGTIGNVDFGLPEYHNGGIVQGIPGQNVPIMAEAGETVIPVGATKDRQIIINVAGSIRSDREFIEIIQRELLRLDRLNYTTGIS